MIPNRYLKAGKKPAEGNTDTGRAFAVAIVDSNHGVRNNGEFVKGQLAIMKIPSHMPKASHNRKNNIKHRGQVSLEGLFLQRLQMVHS